MIDSDEETPSQLKTYKMRDPLFSKSRDLQKQSSHQNQLWGAINQLCSKFASKYSGKIDPDSRKKSMSLHSSHETKMKTIIKKTYPCCCPGSS
jgi:hypothetical protein